MGGLSRTMRSLTSTSTCAFLPGSAIFNLSPSTPRLAAPTSGAFHPAEIPAPILAEIRPVELGGAVQLHLPAPAHVVAHPALTDPAVEDVPADLAVVRQEVPVIAGD